MVLTVHSAWHHSIAKDAPCVQDIIHSGKVIQTPMPNFGRPTPTESKQMLQDLDNEDSEYAANLAKYMAEKDMPRLRSKL